MITCFSICAAPQCSAGMPAATARAHTCPAMPLNTSSPCENVSAAATGLARNPAVVKGADTMCKLTAVSQKDASSPIPGVTLDSAAAAHQKVMDMRCTPGQPSPVGCTHTQQTTTLNTACSAAGQTEGLGKQLRTTAAVSELCTPTLRPAKQQPCNRSQPKQELLQL